MNRHNAKILICILLSLLLVNGLKSIFIGASPVINDLYIRAVPAKTAAFLSSLIPKPKPSSIITQLQTGQISPFPTVTDESVLPTPVTTVPASQPTVVVPTFTSPTTIIPTTGPGTPRPTRTRPTRTPTPSPNRTPTHAPTSPPTSSCPTTSSEQYATRGLNPPDLGAESNPDTNAFLRGWGEVNEALQLVSYGYPNGEPPDPRAPQLGTLLNNGAQFTKAYRVHQWDWANRRPSSAYETLWPVSVLGFKANSGQVVSAPTNGYDIGGGNQYMVIYANPTSITMNVIGDDNAIEGYALHVDGICVDPNLLALYRKLHSEGRRSMPALKNGQKMGTAKGTEVRVMVRDSGSFLDPRSKGDWWRGY